MVDEVSEESRLGVTLIMIAGGLSAAIVVLISCLTFFRDYTQKSFDTMTAAESGALYDAVRYSSIGAPSVYKIVSSELSIIDTVKLYKKDGSVVTLYTASLRGSSEVDNTIELLSTYSSMNVRVEITNEGTRMSGFLIVILREVS